MDLNAPPRLAPGATIGLIAPASAPRDPARTARGIDHLEARGYRVIGPREWPDRTGYLSAPDSNRLEAFERLVDTPECDLLLAVRGGYGCLRLLPELPYEQLRTSPRLVVGYSDVSALHLALLARAGVPGLAGPMIDPDWAEIDPWTESQFHTQAERTDAGPVALTGPDSRPRVLRPGRAEGPLIASNLTLLTRLLGTPYLPDLRGAILLVEDVGEPPYRIDGMLAQLRHSGLLAELAGLLFGRFTDGAPEEPSLTLETVLETYADHVEGPVLADVAYGHERPMGSFPVGVPAELEAETPETARLRTRTPFSADRPPTS